MTHSKRTLMNDKEFHTVLRKYLKGKSTPEEDKVVENFYRKNQDKELFNDYSREEELRVRNQIKTRVIAEIRKDQRPRRNLHKRYLRVAATVVMLLAASYTIYQMQATTPETQFITKTTARGQRATITLSDGTRVHLNAESSIAYPKKFEGLSERSIDLVGEAFFDVKKNPDYPFVVKSGALRTTVLGTSFNVQAYEHSDNIQVTVATGKVKVESEDLQQAFLVPGDRVIYHESTRLLTQGKVDVEAMIAWKEGTLEFIESTEREVIEKLSRWYAVEIEIQGQQGQEWNVSGHFQDKSLEFVLNSLSYSVGFEYSMQKEKVIIKYNN